MLLTAIKDEVTASCAFEQGKDKTFSFVPQNENGVFFQWYREWNDDDDFDWDTFVNFKINQLQKEQDAFKNNIKNIIAYATYDKSK